MQNITNADNIAHCNYHKVIDIATIAIILQHASISD